jgi:3-oxoacyl-[acyl-carrier protein] reductase
VVVTGASGGIGAACARAFAAEGARVLVHYHRGEDRAQALAHELGGAPVAQADLTVERDVERLFSEARTALDTVDVCVEVQGVWPREDVPVWELPLERWEETGSCARSSGTATARSSSSARRRASSARPGTRTTPLRRPP